ncbi:SchA/CurD-like domain-containing protein [Streptomyces sp. LaPpAH-108]|uniref:SchA/CurD-like domain-containing protein n=1 Tax=Streptomyces sp. LaPpAH-108 TaxID=1155714 RepID=UPI0003652930|nr:SchA/CurD-like domain-containing protein [Streptomyces sp. LaPpAH-108]
MTTTSERPSGTLTREVSQRVSQSVFDGSPLRVVLLVDVFEGAQQQFLEAYEQLCAQVAQVPGHVSDQLCQSIENPSQWLITSEWESAPPFLTWVNSEEHVRMVEPLHSCVRDTRSLRFHIVRETSGASAAAQSSPDRHLQEHPRIGDGIIRHALTFTVKPGTEDKVRKILADYASPEAQVDDGTRLLRTSLFMHGNRVVRAIEVRGDLLAALRHVARQPQIRAVEEAINPYLEQDRDLDDQESARMFFTRAALPAVHHVMTEEAAEGTRLALFYPARSGQGMRVAELLSQSDQAAAQDPRSTVLRSTVFQRDDVVVRLVNARGDDVDALPGDPAAAAEVRALLDGEAARMDLVTDRRSPGA